MTGRPVCDDCRLSRRHDAVTRRVVKPVRVKLPTSRSYEAVPARGSRCRADRSLRRAHGSTHVLTLVKMQQRGPSPTSMPSPCYTCVTRSCVEMLLQQTFDMT